MKGMVIKMRKKKFNALLALLLVFSMAFSQPAAVFAEENATVADDEDNVPAITEDENNAGEALTGEENVPETGIEDSDDGQNQAGGGDSQTENGDEESGQTPDGDDDSQTGNENGEDVQNPDEGDGSQEGEENGEDIQTPEDEASEENKADEEGGTQVEDKKPDEALERQAKINGISVDKQKKLNELGFQTMALTQSMREDKVALTQVVSTMANMEPDTDYIEGELVYLAASEEEAKKIAECYGGTISDYSYGVAVADIEQTVMDAVKIAADTTISIPAVYPNIIYTIDEEWDSSTVDTSDITIAEVSQDESNDSADTEEGASEPVDSEEGQIATQSAAELNSQWHHATIHTEEAWGTSDESKGKGVTVAVLDTGVDYDHPDLKDNIVGHISTVDSGDGMDTHGHGTHCAGLIAAAENGTGVVGVAPKASIYSVQTMGADGSGDTSSIVKGLEAALTKNVDVISMSLGSQYYDALEQKAINKVLKKGIVVVAAAGNGADTHRVDKDNYIVNKGVPYKEYPAGYDNVIAVAATDSKDCLTDFSNYGSWVDIAAPGGEIYSTVPTSTGKSHDYKSGTSMACPIVAGTVALMLANNKTLRDTNTIASVKKIRNDLVASADPEGADSYYYWYKNEYYNGGYDNNRYYPLLNAAEAVYSQLDGLVAPTITFVSPAADAKNNVAVGAGTTFTLAAGSEHDKIYYTVNGKKPTPATGTLYEEPVPVQSAPSGKLKIQAIAVRGSRTSKVLSKTFTLKFAVSGVYPSGVGYTTTDNVPQASMKVVIGKSMQLAVAISPFNATNKKITWTCSDPSKGIKVNKSGKVTCSKTTPENTSVVITAESQDESKKKCEFTITAVKDAVSGLTLDKDSLTLSRFAPSDGSEVSFGDTAKYKRYHDIAVTSAGAANTQYLYKSSNTKVATVTANGRIYAQSKGKAKITVTANDGSGKKAVCNVTVVTPVLDIVYLSSTGYSGDTNYSKNYYAQSGIYPIIPIATGCSINMKTWTNFSDQKLSGSYKRLMAPTNKSLEWTSSDESKLTVKNGKVTCKKDATPDSKINVTISAKKGYGYRESVTVTFLVIDKVEKIYLSSTGGNENISVLPWSGKEGSMLGDPLHGIGVKIGNSSKTMKLKVKTATGKEYDLYDYMTKYEACDLVSINVTNKDVVQNICYWHFDIPEPEYDFYWLATKPGSAKINYVLNDGSKKKWSLSVKISK